MLSALTFWPGSACLNFHSGLPTLCTLLSTEIATIQWTHPVLSHFAVLSVCNALTSIIHLYLPTLAYPSKIRRYCSSMKLFVFSFPFSEFTPSPVFSQALTCLYLPSHLKPSHWAMWEEAYSPVSPWPTECSPSWTLNKHLQNWTEWANLDIYQNCS